MCLEVKELSYGLCASCLDKISYNNISDQDNSDNEEETKADPPSPEVSSYSYTIDSETPSTIPDSLETARSIANQSSEWNSRSLVLNETIHFNGWVYMYEWESIKVKKKR